MYETFEEGRDSIRKALNRCEFSAAFNKIDEILDYLKKSISELQEYQYRIGSKSDKNSAKSDQIIQDTGASITRAFSYVQTIKEYTYESRTEKNKAMKTLKELENKLITNKQIFEKLTIKIKDQGQKVIDSHRNSIRLSYNSGVEQKQSFIDEQIYLREIEEKEKIINTIRDVTNQLNDLSKQTADSVLMTGQKIDTIEANVTKMNTNIEKAVSNMKEAKEASDTGNGYSSKFLYIVLAVVCFLIILALIMPK